MLDFTGLGKHYDGRAVLDDLQGRFGAGALALRGPNGIGKSTLLRVLAGVTESDAGTVRIDGHDLRADPLAARSRLAYVPDECPVYPFISGHAFLEFVAWAKRCPVGEPALAVAEAFGLGHHLNTRCGAMSLGTQKKLMLAAAWIGDPALLLLDEPSNGLDAAARVTLIDLLRAKSASAAVLMSTHDQAFADAAGAAMIEFDSLRAHAPAPAPARA